MLTVTWTGEVIEVDVDPAYHRLPTPVKVLLLTDLQHQLEQLREKAFKAMGKHVNKVEQLTPAECAVVVGALRGLTTRELARKTGQAAGTVSALRHRAFAKLGIHEAAQLAVAIAERVK